MARRKKSKDAVQEGSNQGAQEAAPAVDSPVEVVVATEQETAKVLDELLANPDLQKVMDELAPHDISEETKLAQQKKKFVVQNPDEEVMTLEQAAIQMVDGFKESWLPAIRVKAKSMGFEKSATKAEWRAVFVAWGSLAILK